MFSDEEIKEFQKGVFQRPRDDIISTQGIRDGDKKGEESIAFINETLLSNTGRESAVVRSQDYGITDAGLFADSDFHQHGGHQGGGGDSHVANHPPARFSWAEDEGGFDTTSFGQVPPDDNVDFEKEFDMAMNRSNSGGKVNQDMLNLSGGDYKSQGFILTNEPTSLPPLDQFLVCHGTSSADNSSADAAEMKKRYHFVKYLKKCGRTVKVWECGMCGREFQHQYTLMRHLPTHTDERNYHCATCGKRFRQLSTLSQHRAIHSLDRPYACEICSKTFNRVSTLISHRKTHAGDKPYKCSVCSKGFHQKGNLRNHLFTHTNERPYRCNLCDKGFNQQSNLVCHRNKVHNEEARSNLVCPCCSRTFPRESALQYHFKFKHEKETSICPISNLQQQQSSSWSQEDDGLHETIIPETSPKVDVPAEGVIVDAIRTRHMTAAIKRRQVPFALLKPEAGGAPVLVRVVDTALPGGKQILVPVTAEELKIVGKIVMDNQNPENVCLQDQSRDGNQNGFLQIRVPIVATVVPRVKPGGGLSLTVEEPHDYYEALASDGALKENIHPCPGVNASMILAHQVFSTAGNVNCRHEDAIAPATASTGVQDLVLNNCSGAELASLLASPGVSYDICQTFDLFEPMEYTVLGSVPFRAADETASSLAVDSVSSAESIDFTEYAPPIHPSTTTTTYIRL